MRVYYKTLWLAAAVVASLPSQIHARELYVDPSGGGDYTTITAAVAAAVARDTVVVACGTYQEPRIIILKNISIRSETRHPECVTLDGQGINRIMAVGRGDSTQYIEGFTFANGYINYEWSDAGALGIDAHGATVRNCVFRNNVSVQTTAGALGFRFFLRVIGCQFYDNSAATWGGAIYTPGADQLIIKDCTFAGNSAHQGGAIWVECPTTIIERSVFVGNRAAPQWDGCSAICIRGNTGALMNCSLLANESPPGGASIEAPGSALSIENSLVAFDAGGAAVRCVGAGSATASCCDFFGNAGGDWTGCLEGQLGTDGNISADPLLCEPPAPGHPPELHANSPCAPENSPCGELIGSAGVGCDASVVESVSWGRIKALYR
jgi:predicted outer membrane repeat protein